MAPIRYPVLRSCEVSPASAEAMQTTPPMVMARAPKAGAVQPLTRKMAEVAMSVAMVMPEMGLAEAADEADDARADGDKEESEEDDEQRGGEVGHRLLVALPAPA